MLRSRGGPGVAYARHARCRRGPRRLRPTRMGAGHARRCPRSCPVRRCHGRRSRRAGASCVSPAGCRQERGPADCRQSRPRRPRRRTAGISEPALRRPCDVSGRRRSGAPDRFDGRNQSARAMLRQVCALGSVRTSCSLAAPALTAEGGEPRERPSPRPDHDRPGATWASHAAVRVLPEADRGGCLLLLVDSKTTPLGVLPGLSTAGHPCRPYLAALAGRGQRGRRVSALTDPLSPRSAAPSPTPSPRAKSKCRRSQVASSTAGATKTKEPLDDDA